MHSHTRKPVFNNDTQKRILMMLGWLRRLHRDFPKSTTRMFGWWQPTRLPSFGCLKQIEMCPWHHCVLYQAFSPQFPAYVTWTWAAAASLLQGVMVPHSGMLSTSCWCHQLQNWISFITSNQLNQFTKRTSVWDWVTSKLSFGVQTVPVEKYFELFPEKMHYLTRVFIICYINVA